MPVRLIQQPLLVVGLELPRAHGQDPFRRALDQYLAAAVAGVQGGHETVLGFEGNHVQPRPVDLSCGR